MRTIWNPFLLWKIYKNSGKDGIAETESFFKNLKKLTNKRLYFANFNGANGCLNASATIPGLLYFNVSWTKLLLANKTDENIINAFLMTLGHEEGHQTVGKECPSSKFNENDRCFVKWLNEVYCDFYGLNVRLSNDKEKYYRAVNLKLKERKNIKDGDSETHPSWEKRCYYISKYDFGADLINEIAGDANCSNYNLIAESKEFYINLFKGV